MIRRQVGGWTVPSPRKIQAVAGGQIASSLISFTGPADRTYFDSDGIMQTVGSNEARTTYIGGNPYLWIDGAVEEISGRSHDIDNWSNFTSAAAVQDAIGLDGQSNTGFTVADDSGAAVQQRGLVTGDASGSHTLYQVTAIKFEESPGVVAAVWLEKAQGTQIAQRTIIDKNTGDTVQDTTDGSLVLGPIRFGDYWILVQSLTDNASGNGQTKTRLYPAWNTTLSTSFDDAATGSTVYGYCGLFKDNFSLLPILTTGGTTKSLAAEVASLTNSIIASLTEGTIYMEIWSPQLTSNTARHIAELESDANNFIRVLNAADGDLDAQITDGGASQAALAGTDLTVGQLQKVALTFKANEFSLYRGGTQLATDTAGTVPSVDTLLIGAGLFGGIKTLNVHTTAWSQAKAESETT